MVKAWIIDWFKENGQLKDDSDFDKSYIDEEIIDSIGFVSLIADCEDNFGIEFTEQDFENENILTINGLIKCIEEKL